jgi:hypothetical protein
MKSYLSKKILTATVSLFALTATANAAYNDYETVTINSNITIGNSQTESIQLNGVHRVKNIVVQAEGIGSDSTIEVMVNGQVKGTIYAPGRDPSYVVTVEEATRSIEFRHRLGGSTRIISMTVTQSVWSKPSIGNGGGFYGDKELVQQLAGRILSQIDFLSTLARPDEIKDYLFPIKKNAGLVYVMSNAHGNLSKSTIAQLIALIDQIDFAQKYLNTLMVTDAAFDSVVEILTVRETIADLID